MTSAPYDIYGNIHFAAEFEKITFKINHVYNEITWAAYLRTDWHWKKLSNMR